MPPILFPTSSSPGKDPTESAGRLINAYAERLPEGAPGGFVRRRAPGLTMFADLEGDAVVDAGAQHFGLWFDGSNALFGVLGNELISVDAFGTGAVVGGFPGDTSVLYYGRAQDTSTASSYTFAATPIGVAHAARLVVVAITVSGASADAPSSVTIGGSAMTQISNVSGSVTGGAIRTLIYARMVAAGTTADVVVNFSGSANRQIQRLVWRVGHGISATQFDQATSFTSSGLVEIDAPANGAVIAVARNTAATLTAPGLNGDVDTGEVAGFSAGVFGAAQYRMTVSGASAAMAIASWSTAPPTASTGDVATFAKNNNATPNKVVCVAGVGAYSFETGSLVAINVNSQIPNSVCNGEAYFFFTISDGRCYASGVNVTTVTSTDVIRCEARVEPLIRGVFFNGELWLLSATHIEVWGSGGNPNATGFPLNRTTVIWRGLAGPLAVCGFEEGFEGGLFFVADDNSVRMMQGYTPATISTPDLERAIAATTNKSAIRMYVYDLDGHACIVVDLAGTATWVYDLNEQSWHERQSYELDYWRLTGNSVKAFGRWLCGDHLTGNIYEIDAAAMDEDGDPLPFIVESIAMEAFPARLAVNRMDFNFVAGVGNSTVADPEVLIQWSDDGGHKWSDPVTRKLGENGRHKTQVRVNRGGLTGVKGRRFRLTVDDECYVGLIGGAMDVAGRK